MSQVGLPDDVVDDYDALIVKTLSITDERGSALQPRVAAMLVHKTPVVRDRLTFVYNYNKTSRQLTKYTHIRLLKLQVLPWCGPCVLPNLPYI